MNRLLYILIPALILGCALVFNGNLADPVVLPRLLWLAAGSLVLLAVAGWTTRGKTISATLKQPVVAAWAIFIVVAAAMSTTAVNPSEAQLELARTATYLLGLIALIGACTSPAGRNALILAMNVAIPIIIAIVIYQQWWLDSTPYSYQLSLRPEAFFANQNILGVAMLLLLPASVFYILGKQSWKVWMGAINTMLVLFSMVWLKLAGTLAAVGIVVPTMLIVGYALRKQFAQSQLTRLFGNRKLMLGIGIAGTLVLGIVTLAVFNRASTALELLANWDRAETLSTLGTDSSLNDRMLMLQNTKAMIAEHFPSGVGLSNWPIAFQEYGIGGTNYINLGYLRFMRPHNDFLWVLAETGLVGLLAYLAIFGLGIRAAIRAIRRTTGNDQVMAFLALGGILLYVVCAQFYFPKERIFLSLELLIFLAIPPGFMIEKAKVNQKANAKWLAPTGLALATVLSAVVGIWGFQRMQAETAANIAFLAKQEGMWDLSISNSTAAVDAGMEIDPTGTPIEWYTGVALQQQGAYNQAIEAFEAARTHNPHHITLLNDLAGCYAIVGQPDKAIEHYEHALEITPCYPDAIRNLSVVLFQNNQSKRACELLERDCLRERWDLPEFQQAIGVIFNHRLSELTGTTAQLDQEAIFDLYKRVVESPLDFETYLLNNYSTNG